MGLSLAHSRLAALTDRPVEAPEFSSRVASALSAAVPLDGWCLFGLDPLTGMRTVQFGQNGVDGTAELARNEAVMHDVNSYRDLAAAARPSSWLSPKHPQARSSFRLNEILLPQSYSSELRLVLREAGVTWGALVLFRGWPGAAFDDHDAADICALARPLTRALRAYPTRHVPEPRRPSPGAGVVVVGEDDQLIISGEAQRWLADLVPGGDDQTYSSDVTRVVFDAAHAVSRRDPTGTAAATVRTVSGHWLRVEAATTATGQDVAVVLHAATTRQLLPTLKIYYDLSRREGQILDRVTEGLAGKQIAHELGISLYTVNEHLRSIYRKFGVRGRDQLFARLI